MQLSNYHSHCTFCDGRSTPEDFIKFAVAHGFRAYGFSSHSPLPFETFWNMSKDDMPEYLTEIERLKKKYSDRLEIYVGLEIDFLDESYNASIPYFRNLPLDYRIGSIHFLHTAYADKIRTRMIYESFTMVNFVSLAFIILQPQHIKELGSIMIVNTAPLIAHFITYTKGKITNIMFITMLVMTVLILLYNIFIPETVLLQAVQGLSIHG